MPDPAWDHVLRKILELAHLFLKFSSKSCFSRLNHTISLNIDHLFEVFYTYAVNFLLKNIVIYAWPNTQNPKFYSIKYVLFQLHLFAIPTTTRTNWKLTFRAANISVNIRTPHSEFCNSDISIIFNPKREIIKICAA